MTQKVLSPPLRLLLVDSDERYAHELMLTLDPEQFVEIVGHGRNCEEGLRFALALRPDAVLMSAKVPDCGGVEATRRLVEQWPEACVLILNDSSEDDTEEASRNAGAGGYIDKDSEFRDVLAGICSITVLSMAVRSAIT